LTEKENIEAPKKGNCEGKVEGEKSLRDLAKIDAFQIQKVEFSIRFTRLEGVFAPEKKKRGGQG